MLLWPRGRMSGYPGSLPEDCHVFLSKLCYIVIRRIWRVSKREKKHKPQLIYLPAVDWSKEGSGYFSPATVPNSGSGIRCGSITLSWTLTEMALFSRLVLLQQRQRNHRHSGSSRRRVIPRWRSKESHNVCHHHASFIQRRTTLCATLRVRIQATRQTSADPSV